MVPIQPLSAPNYYAGIDTAITDTNDAITFRTHTGRGVTIEQIISNAEETDRRLQALEQYYRAFNQRNNGYITND